MSNMHMNSAEYRAALGRCEKAQAEWDAMPNTIAGNSQHLESLTIHRGLMLDLKSALRTIAELTKERNELCEKSIRTGWDVTARDKTIATLQKRVEGLEAVLGRVAENPDSCLTSPSLFWDVKDALKKAANPSGERKGRTMRFRKKPVVVEAEKVPQNEDVRQWAILGAFLGYDGQQWAIDRHGDIRYVEIHTLEGVMRADPGDWIIRGVKGELYPCKPDIFEATYETVIESGEKGG